MNPYQPPLTSAAPVANTSDNELASRWQRFCASLVDSVVSAVFALPLALVLGTFEYVKARQQPPLHLTLIAALLGFIFFTIVHGYFLKKDGQTIGKRSLKIKIVDLNNVVPSFSTIIFKRYLPIGVILLIPKVGALLSFIDILFIFGKNKRCVHDYIAGTKVIKVVDATDS